MRTHDDLHTLAAPYVLGALPDDEQARFEDHLDDCDECARQVAQLQDGALELGTELEEAPPAGLRDRLMAEARRTPQEAPTAEKQQTPLEAPTAEKQLSPREPPTAEVRSIHSRRGGEASPWALRATAVAASVLAIAVAGLAYVVADLTDRVETNERLAQQAQQDAERYEELLAAPDARLTTVEADDGVTARLLYSTTRDEALITTDQLQPTTADRTYQLWVIDDDGASPAGIFDSEPDGRAVVPLTGDLDAGVLIGVTEEPAGGSEQPTTDPILAIELD